MLDPIIRALLIREAIASTRLDHGEVQTFSVDEPPEEESLNTPTPHQRPAPGRTC